jgi:two-component system chemotaxis response regulator CheB
MHAGVEKSIKVLIIDDSALVRRILADALAGEPGIEVVGTAPDPIAARDKISALHPDVLTLDIEMPRMDGLTFLAEIMSAHPLPVIVISSIAQAGCAASLRAIEYGAVEVLGKPNGPYSVGDLRLTLASKVRAASVARLRNRTSAGRIAATKQIPAVKAPPTSSRDQFDTIVAIGASTGGTEAIRQILEHLPAGMPPITVVQHIPAGFSRAFADRLNGLVALHVKEASNWDPVLPGQVLIAPGDQHMLLRRGTRGYAVELKNGPRVCYQRPSVDVLFESLAVAKGCRLIGVLLTGMGNDGASGLLRLRNAGAATIAQDESSSVIYGMPREAAKLGAAQQILPLEQIATALQRLCAGQAVA